MDVTFAAATDVGRQRAHNQDNFLVDKKLRLYLVADGMGGHAAGEVASAMAVHEVREAIAAKQATIAQYRVDNPVVQAYEILQILEQAVTTACAAIFAAATDDPAKRGMGTTCSLLLIAGHGEVLRGFIAHVGDSRIYLIRNGETHILTEDHSLINELLKRGKATKDQLGQPQFRKLKNAITRAVGIYADVAVDTFDLDILPGDRFVLCSDGLHAYLDTVALPTLLDQTEIAQAPAQLISLANAGGGHDNITSIVVQVEAESKNLELSQAKAKLEVLKRSKLFRHLTYKELVGVANATVARTALAGEVLFTEGMPGESMYIVIAGAVALHKGNNVVATVEPGEHFGEMALIERQPRSLAAISKTDTRLIEITRPEFFALVRANPEAAVKMLWSLIEVLGARLRKTNEDLDDALTNRDTDTLSDSLFGLR